MSVSRPLPLSPPIVAPSILSADFSRLATEVAIADPARDWLHCDVMDNRFVPNLTFGPIVVEAIRKLTPALLDVHLMVDRPERLIPAFIDAGADLITVHLEAEHERGLLDVFALIKQGGARAGLALKPKTPIGPAMPYLRKLDLLLVMTVEPGFGGQAFMTDQMAKVTAAKEWRDKNAAHFLIEVDGGISAETAPIARNAGADVFVAGNAVFRAENPSAAVERLRGAVQV
jgi:ribulose-phosphate 3-epimerase